MTQASTAATASTLTNLALIHGWGIGQAAWQPLRDALDPALRVHLIDLPGYGRAPANSATFAQNAEALLDTLPAGTVLCGWSLGGMLALQAACLAPERIGGLILIGATPSFTQRDDWQPAQPPALLQSFAAAIADDAAGTLQRFIALLNQGDRKARNAIRTLGQALSSSPVADTGSLLQGLDWLRDIDLRPQLAAFTTLAVPALLIHGEHDPLMPLAAAQWLHARLKASQLESHLEIIPGAAHAPFIHTPERIAALIGDYCHASALDKATRPRII